MFKSYFVSIIRGFSKHKVYTIINIGGLSIAICLGILLMLYVKHEYSTDKHHEKADQIYRLVNLHNKRIKTNVFFADFVKDNFPEVEESCRYALFGGDWYYNDRKYSLEKVFLCEPSVFNIFSYNCLTGSLESVFTDPNSIVLTESLSHTIFGNENPIGKILKLENNYSLKVSGIIEDIPRNSSYWAQALIPFELMKIWRPELWQNEGYWSVETLLLMNKKVDIEAFHAKLKPLIIERFQRESDFTIQPLTDIYFNNNVSDDEPHGNINLLYLFILVVVIIILIAGINYINITSARAPLRAKEMGLRKVVGARQKMLVWQILIESSLVSFMSLIIGFLMAEMLISTFNTLIEGHLMVKTFYSFRILPFIVLASLTFGLITGLYPASVISSFSTVEILKGNRSSKIGGATLRRLLLIFQFVISICLIITTIAIYKQLDYVKKLDLGFDKDHIVCITLPRNLQSQDSISQIEQALKFELLNIAGVESLSYSDGIPGRVRNGMYATNKLTGEEIQMRHLLVDADFFEVYGLEILEGRKFKPNNDDDRRNAFLVTEAALKSFDLTDLYHAEMYGGRKCIGVVKDFNFKSLHSPIEPLFFTNTNNFTDLSIRMNPNNISATMQNIENTWNSFYPNNIMEYHFVDEVFDAHYKREYRLGRIFIYFSIFAIIIAGLGLLGLTSFMIIQRTKEIGIRKVMGGSNNNILFLLNKEFIMLITISFVISIPLSWYLVDSILQNFAFKTNISWWVFIFAGLFTAVISVLTVTMQVWKIISKNPVESLRYE